jgi:hypothetical protein
VVAVTVRLNDRDLYLVTWLGEQYGAPLSLVRAVMDAHATRSGIPGPAAPAPGIRRQTEQPDRLSAARKWVARMQTARLVQQTAAVGRLWVVPTRAGLRFAGLPYHRWQPSGWELAHIEAVARVRLTLETAHPEAGWECERAIRARWAGTGARVRLADAGLHLPDGRVVGVEVELHVKRPDRYQAATADQDPAWTDGVWWFTPAAQVELLRRRLDDAGAFGHQVFALPEAVAR